MKKPYYQEPHKVDRIWVDEVWRAYDIKVDEGAVEFISVSKVQALIEKWEDMDMNDYPLCRGVILDMIAALQESIDQ